MTCLRNIHNIADKKLVPINKPLHSTMYGMHPTVARSNKRSYEIGLGLMRTGV